jgi:hypothetical protein
LKEDFVRNMSRRKTGATKNIREIRRQEDGTAELGRESVTVTSKPILCARSANETVDSFLQKKSIISFLCQKAARINSII